MIIFTICQLFNMLLTFEFYWWFFNALKSYKLGAYNIICTLNGRKCWGSFFNLKSNTFNETETGQVN